MKQDVILFGASKLGRVAKVFLENHYKILGFCDNDPGKWGIKFEGYQVFSPIELKKFNAEIIITSCYHREISKQLNELGITNKLSVFSLSLKNSHKLKNNGIIMNDQMFLEIYHRVKEYTLTSIERIYALYQAIKYIINNDIEGDFVECGVWRGGSAMTMALTLKALGVTTKNIYLYDTYSGMSEPTEKDINYNGNKALEIYERKPLWCYAGLEEVKKNLKSTGYPQNKFFFIEGLVENTIPSIMPNLISLLRLDTDWYESTYHELKYLYPVIAHNGVLIVDDYGHWQGAKEAVDQYFNESQLFPLFNRIDYTGIMCTKQK